MEEEWDEETPAFFEGFGDGFSDASKSARKINREKHSQEYKHCAGNSSSTKDSFANIENAKAKIAAAVLKNASSKELLKAKKLKRNSSSSINKRDQDTNPRGRNSSEWHGTKSVPSSKKKRFSAKKGKSSRRKS